MSDLPPSITLRRQIIGIIPVHRHRLSPASHPSMSSIPWDYTTFGYEPSTPLAVLTVVAFALLALGHTAQAVWFKSGYMWSFAVGSAIEVVGFAARLVAKGNPISILPYAVRHGLIVIAPIMFAAGCYVVLSRIIGLLGDQYSRLPHRLVARAFIARDIFSGKWSERVHIAAHGTGTNLTSLKEVNVRVIAVTLPKGAVKATLGAKIKRCV
ncbi:hypothetical protein M427DRAFT_135888 [Gonapodya prolifera JEL478]|uniref:RTA1-domain-containing protein n=1 Tax=Gonapodya prolifera (strain JEL478) TaxID=1344416 RepID=A0A139ABU5_GONPJ|nr:hypothetical protein M427DRAFT_135888 [Gonapodya prolifera JEL478]|eukprot:KXS14276.1 hypothetical protein M427DRAFT_135888 [Gonapodya prolifera JEL478]